MLTHGLLIVHQPLIEPKLKSTVYRQRNGMANIEKGSTKISTALLAIRQTTRKAKEKSLLVPIYGAMYNGSYMNIKMENH